MVKSPTDIAQRALTGDRPALARLISLVEDGSPDLSSIMREIHPHTGHAYTIGLTGSPGAGKSTLTEALISEMRAAGHSVAVLAVDPSSPFSGGALLGDRVRMQSHATDDKVFIRSMATRGHLGGLSLATPEAARVLDAAKFDFVIIETVGVGQSEIEVAGAADTTIVVLTPGWGDGVQAGKAGLLEIADIFVVNKADRDGVRQTVREIKQMLTFAKELGVQGTWKPPVVETVATKPTGVDDLFAAVLRHREHLESTGELVERRRRRVESEIAEIVAERIRTKIMADIGPEMEPLAKRVIKRELDPYEAASLLIDKLGQ